MGKKTHHLSADQIQFIRAQKLFFVATAAPASRINISPKGLDTLRIVNENRIVWLNLTGSANETAAHVQENSQMTLMFCAFEGNPLILRVYGQARAVHLKDPDWKNLFSLFPPLPGARQLFDLSIELVHASCGMGVPFYQYISERNQLEDWAAKKGEEGIKQYWAQHNQLSLDEKPTNIILKNT